MRGRPQVKETTSVSPRKNAGDNISQLGGRAGGARRTVPALHGDTRRRPDDRLDVKHGDRRPRRIRRSRDVAACFGLTSKRRQSGTSIDVQGRISKAGDPEVRRALYEAASAMLTRYKGKTALKSWGPKIAKRCHKKAVVAMAESLPSSCTGCGGTARSMRIGSTPTTCPTPRRRQRIARFSAPTHDVRRGPSTPTGAQLSAHGDPLRRMRTGADHGRREARYLACGRSDPGPRSSACDAAPPIRCRHAPRRIDDR